jgi:hypothetical protein
MKQMLDEQARAIFLAIADVLIPETLGMPSASQVDVGGPVLDRLLALRPDLEEAFFRGVLVAAGKDSASAVQALNRDDPKALTAIGLLASAAYYMDPRVRELIGYPGQEKRTYDPDATPEYITNGMLQVVIDRGPIYRPTPK